MASISFSGRTRERVMPEQIRRQQKNGGGAMELMGSNPRSSGEAGPLNFFAPFFGTRHFSFFFKLILSKYKIVQNPGFEPRTF